VTSPITYGECGCGCGTVGRLKKPHRDGIRCVSRKCSCRRCQGQRNRATGLAKQRIAARKVGVEPRSNEEHWSDPLFVTEVKSGKQCGPLARWWSTVVSQIDANQPDQHKARRAIAMPAGWGARGLVVVELDTWEQMIRPALTAAYGEER
jgi:hypothetical protein